MSCCRRGKPPPASATLCASLGMSTPAMLTIDTTPVLKVRLNNEWTLATTALTSLGCSEDTLSHRLVTYVSKLAASAFSTSPDRASSVLGKQMTLVTLRTALLPFVTRCAACAGRGCSSCDMLGFR